MAGPADTHIAFVDESIRHRSPSLYVIAAVVLSDDPASARRMARGVLLRGQRRFHWHEESEKQRLRMLQEMAGLAVDGRVFACRGLEGHKEKRARALCMNTMLWDLWKDDVGEVVIESRQEHNDQRDRATISRAQRARQASPSLRYGFARPVTDPVLWLADALAGAAAASLADDAPYLDVLGDRVRITSFEP